MYLYCRSFLTALQARTEIRWSIGDAHNDTLQQVASAFAQADGRRDALQCIWPTTERSETGGCHYVDLDMVVYIQGCVLSQHTCRDSVGCASGNGSLNPDS